MAKSTRSKVKKRLRTVKRGVVKTQLKDPTSKLGVREAQKSAKLSEAATGYIKPSCATLPPNGKPSFHTAAPPHSRRQA